MKGVKNLTALGNVITWQRVDYDFNFHTQAFHCNLPVLVMSEGKSLLTVGTVTVAFIFVAWVS